MDSKIIVMLTHNDRTVANALEVFESCKDLPIDFWGFKDVGLAQPEMAALIAAMKRAGKTTFLEVVSYSEEECLKGAMLAVELGFDYLMGTLYYPSVWAYLNHKPIRYLPFVGKVSGSPSILEGSIGFMIGEMLRFKELGIPGVDILSYRYVGDPVSLTRDFVDAADECQVVMAGSIGSREQLETVNGINPFAFTMGSALFTGTFVEGGVRENLEEVLRLMAAIHT